MSGGGGGGQYSLVNNVRGDSIHGGTVFTEEPQTVFTPTPGFYKFPRFTVAVHFTYFESIIVYRSTLIFRACSLSENFSLFTMDPPSHTGLFAFTSE